MGPQASITRGVRSHVGRSTSRERERPEARTEGCPDDSTANWHGEALSDQADKRLLAAEQVAARWQVSRAQVYRLAHEGGR